MIKIAEFQKVSFTQFSLDLPKGCNTASYENIRIPKRATAGSAGYDIISPVDFCLEAGQSIRIPTGLRCRMEPGWMLLVMPKSGLGTRFRLQLDNTIGLIDSDYYNAKNEGHIMVSLTNDSKSGHSLVLGAGKAFVQAVFVPYGITLDDEAEGEREGGFGSTGV
ncbi:MAG TPA: deoxyuridine 5'-triphosphate nucleotidohydrolase [Bacillota bacterium]|nr:deoxyuridine 5'-triphosphate nucleotidohydrolase [Bacillota bacterium]